MGRKRKQQVGDGQVISDSFSKWFVENLGTAVVGAPVTYTTSSSNDLRLELRDQPSSSYAYLITIEGEFQGCLVVVRDINVLEDSPVEKVVRAALALEDGDELRSIMVKKADGEIEVRPWNETRR